MPDSPPAPSPRTPTAAIHFLVVIAAFAAVYWLSSILVPFLLALVLAIVLSPVAAKIERTGAGRTVASLACMLAVAVALAGIAGLITYQAGTMAKDGDKYVTRLGEVAAKAIHAVGGAKALQSVEAEAKNTPPGEAPKSGGDDAKAKPESAAKPRSDAKGDPEKAAAAALVTRIRDGIRRDAQEIGRWAMTGLNGLLGLVADAVIFLAFLFYMLQGRAEWMERLRKAALGLGMRPRDREFTRVAYEVRTYLGTLAVVSACYSVVIAGVLWLIGVPQPLLWGALTAVLELVPFFGPFIAGALPTLAALGGSDALWKPAAVVGVFATLQTIEGYVIAPLLYGKAVEIEPVTVILGVLFFGWLLGPAGLALAMPLMILLRGIIVITPDTEALSALSDADEEAARAAESPTGK